MRSPQGTFQYEYAPELLQLPASVQLLNGHGLARGKDGSIYFTYQSSAVTKDTRALIRFSPDGRTATLLGPDNELAYVRVCVCLWYTTTLDSGWGGSHRIALCNAP